jgi:hypothetical protein
MLEFLSRCFCARGSERWNVLRPMHTRIASSNDVIDMWNCFDDVALRS